MGGFEARAFLQAVAYYHYRIDFVNQYVTTVCGLHAALDPILKVCHCLTQVAPSQILRGAPLKCLVQPCLHLALLRSDTRASCVRW